MLLSWLKFPILVSESKNRRTLQTNWHTETASTAVLLRSPALTSGSAAEADWSARAEGLLMQQALPASEQAGNGVE